MTRRTKREMELMNSEARYYLFQTNNNPHKAHDLIIKEHLESAQYIPYYIKGLKDFIKVSQELALELNRKDQMDKRNKERYEEKETIINYIMNLTNEEMKAIYKEYKDNVPQSDKLNLVTVYQLKFNNDLTEKDIDQSIINTFDNLNAIKEALTTPVQETIETVEVETVTNEFDKDQSITTNSPKEAWEQLTQSNQVLMNDNELNSLQEYIDTLSDDEQDLYYKHFASKFDESLACGLLTRCYVCKLNNYTPEAEQTEDESEVITFTSDKSLHGYGTSVHIYDNRNINNTMTYFNHFGNESFTIRLQHDDYNKYWEVEQFIYSIMKEHGKQSDFWTILGNKLNEQYGLYNTVTPDKQHEPKQTKQLKEDKTIKEVIPQLNMIASYAKLIYTGNKVDVTFSNDHESNTITFKRRKSWSHRKYVDKVIKEADIKLTYDFRYGWEIETA